MALLIHVGIRESEADIFRNQFLRLLPDGDIKIESRINGEWPAHYTESMMDDVLHVTIETITPMVLINFIIERFWTFLVPYSGDDKDGTLLYVTDIWSDVNSIHPSEPDEYIELRYPG